MKIMIIDGQGGRIGKQLVENIKAILPDIEILAVGTNSAATSCMAKAGADNCATGENPVIVGARTVDLIVGPIGIVIADSLFGEVTPAMALAVGQSHAQKILIPINKCSNIVVGVPDISTSSLVKQTIQEIQNIIS